MNEITITEVIEETTEHITVPHCHHGSTTGGFGWM